MIQLVLVQQKQEKKRALR